MPRSYDSLTLEAAKRHLLAFVRQDGALIGPLLGIHESHGGEVVFRGTCPSYLTEAWLAQLAQAPELSSRTLQARRQA